MKEKYHIFDAEVQNLPHYGRFSSPWCPLNWIVAHGWKNEGDTECSYSYQPNINDKHSWSIPEDATVLVGHNLRFDLTWIWNEPSFKAFIERGGRVWCTQYAEYLLEGHAEDYHMNSLEQLSEKYGGTSKFDAVKAMWDDGVLTADIPKDMLIDYLVGTEAEKRNGGDIGNTEQVYLCQRQRAVKMGMWDVICARMEGYLATTEMEVNGIKVDMKQAMQDMIEQTAEANRLERELNALIPDGMMPEKAQFNWGSSRQVSAFLFGGYVEYDWRDTYIDENTGEIARTQVEVLHAYLPNGELVELEKLSAEELQTVTRFQSGKRAGEIKTKKVKLPIGKEKIRVFRQIVKFPRQIEPLDEWKTKSTDCMDRPVYSTGADTIDVLLGMDNVTARLYANFKALKKVLGTYYLEPAKKASGKATGMLTFVKPDGILNHYLNHTSTVTSRMSSKSPNLQNIPRADTSVVKRMFKSRFEDGVCIEADYSQLEVVVGGYLTGDSNLIRDILAGVDFHCKRVALKNHITYEEAHDLCKVQELPKWKSERTKCKGYTFQSQYGAGDAAISASTGMTEEEVASIRAAEALEYPDLIGYSDKVLEHIKANAEPYTINFAHGGFKQVQRGYWTTPSGTRYCFQTEDAPEWLRSRGETQTFKPTKVKNYPTQGTGGEIMQIMLGRLFREFLKRGWWSGNPEASALLTNTVHDCVWADSIKAVAEEAGKLIHDTLCAVPETYQELFNVDMGVPFSVDVEYGRDMMTLHHSVADLS